MDNRDDVGAPWVGELHRRLLQEAAEKEAADKLAADAAAKAASKAAAKKPTTDDPGDAVADHKEKT